MRRIKKLNTPGITPALADTAAPIFEEVDPATLYVDEAYQRKLSERSMRLIRSMVERWDWRKFVPPTVSLTPDGKRVVMDGQHTAIGAASNPLVGKIMVKRVHAPEVADQAQAFVGLNRDRINLTPVQMHFAAVAAGDPDAVTISQVCERAGVTILKSPPARGEYKPGETVSVGAIGSLINRRGAMGARKVLDVLTGANAAPLAMAEIKAVEELLHGAEYTGRVKAEAITTAMLRLGSAELEKKAKLFAATHGVRYWNAMTVTLYQEARSRARRVA